MGLRMSDRSFFTTLAEGRSVIKVTKYEALGNDFLILIDLEEELSFSEELAVFLCDRHLGLGADGLIRISAPDDLKTFKMTLRNADGSLAETSGNGLRCSALAVILEVLPSASVHDGRAFPKGGEIKISLQTAVDILEASCHFPVENDATKIMAEISMGTVSVQAIESPIENTFAFKVNAGNPHLVICGDDFHALDLAKIGREQDSAYEEGTNVEFLEIGEAPFSNRDNFPMTVWERGVGLTRACGSGSVASAAALATLFRSKSTAVSIEIPETYVISNPGGDLRVRINYLEEGKYFTYLYGPAQFVAQADVVLPDKIAKKTKAGI